MDHVLGIYFVSMFRGLLFKKIVASEWQCWKL